MRFCLHGLNPSNNNNDHNFLTVLLYASLCKIKKCVILYLKRSVLYERLCWIYSFYSSVLICLYPLNMLRFCKINLSWEYT